MIACWLRQHSDYDGGFWNYWIVPKDIGGNVNPKIIIFTTTQTGYIAPGGEQRYNICILGNYFEAEAEAEASADATGVTIIIINRLTWQGTDMGSEYEKKYVNIWSQDRRF
jgi:hypothetical protein